MGQKSIQKILKNSFTSSDVESWKKTATSELDGTEPFTKLTWRSKSNLSFLPYYDSTNITNGNFETNFLLPPSGDPVFGSRKWLNLPMVSVTDEVTANKKALDYLANGADGILFDLKQSPNANIQNLLSGIQWQYCRLGFKSATSSAFQPALEKYFQLNSDATSFEGNFFVNTIADSSPILSGSKHFKSLSFWIDSSNEAEEIVTALKAMVQAIEVNSENFSTEKIVEQISFSFSLEADFLTTVAKLKAFRMLWYQIVCAYGLTQLHTSDLHIHGRSSSYQNEKFQPHENMLKSTIAAMAGIIGGVDSLTIEAENVDHVMMNRIARNVSGILREEAHFDKVSDPAAGAYAIEEMTAAIAENAWQMFQTTFDK